MNHFFIYAHYKEDPIANPMALPYYIGKGHGDRYRVTTSRNKHHTHILKKYGLHYSILENNLSEKQAFARECFYINKYGRKQLGDGILVNATNGGEGSSGHIQEKRRIPHIFVLETYCIWRPALHLTSDARNGNIDALKTNKRKSIDIGLGERVLKIIESKYKSARQSKLHGELEHSQYKVQSRNFRGDHISRVAKEKCSIPCFLKYSNGKIEEFKSFMDASRKHQVGNSNLVQWAKGKGNNVSLKSNTKKNISIIGVGYSYDTIYERERLSRRELAKAQKIGKTITVTYENGEKETFSSARELNEAQGFPPKSSNFRSLEKGAVKRIYSKTKQMWVIKVVSKGDSSSGLSKGPVIGTNIEDPSKVIILHNHREIREAGFHPGNISNCITGGQATHKGYLWRRAA